jgi:hypothetical protein
MEKKFYDDSKFIMFGSCEFLWAIPFGLVGLTDKCWLPMRNKVLV